MWRNTKAEKNGRLQQPHFASVSHPNYEAGLVKIMTKQESTLTVQEKKEVIEYKIDATEVEEERGDLTDLIAKKKE
jgi:hypothetical protein